MNFITLCKLYAANTANSQTAAPTISRKSPVSLTAPGDMVSFSSKIHSTGGIISFFNHNDTAYLEKEAKLLKQYKNGVYNTEGWEDIKVEMGHDLVELAVNAGKKDKIFEYFKMIIDDFTHVVKADVKYLNNSLKHLKNIKEPSDIAQLSKKDKEKVMLSLLPPKNFAKLFFSQKPEYVSERLIEPLLEMHKEELLEIVPANLRVNINNKGLNPDQHTCDYHFIAKENIIEVILDNINNKQIRENLTPLLDENMLKKPLVNASKTDINNLFSKMKKIEFKKVINSVVNEREKAGLKAITDKYNFIKSMEILHNIQSDYLSNNGEAKVLITKAQNLVGDF